MNKRCEAINSDFYDLQAKMQPGEVFWALWM